MVDIEVSITAVQASGNRVQYYIGALIETMLLLASVLGEN